MMLSFDVTFKQMCVRGVDVLVKENLHECF
jgi:hypothetical protein